MLSNVDTQPTLKEVLYPLYFSKLNKDKCCGILSPNSQKPFLAKGNEPMNDGNTANVLPPSLKKFSQYKLFSANESINGVKLPR